MCCVMLVICMSGCSERKEIEERGFVVGAAFDVVKEESEEKKPPRMKGTYQLVLPSALAQQGKQGADGAQYMNINVTADSLFTQIREASKKISRSLFFPHIKVVIFSKDLLKRQNFLEQTLDIFFRAHEMRRNIKIFVSKNQAGKIFEQNAKPENFPAKYIDLLADHADVNSFMLEAVRIGEVQEMLTSKRSFVLPVLELTKQGVKMEGAAIFKGENNKLVGLLSGKDTQGLNYIIGKKVGGFLTIRKKEKVFTYEIHKIRRKIRASFTDPRHPKFIIDMYPKGVLGEVYLGEDAKAWSEKRINSYITKEMERIVGRTIKKVQKEYKTDVLGLGDYYKRHNYKKWKKVEKNWDYGENYFMKTDIAVRVHPVVEHSGSLVPKGGQ
ncbi:Ger(x)C family spore germination protein [Bacillus cytotoxicus]|nr:MULTISPECIES: Ger(x)C family spore germination protein [Bacillus cereus group]AWC34832.1 Ger(x)C family spore germination protein [Bacillus cytotoxicus]AWC38826.1 Ger(x)C family spore germination protein [Bacillus cytotoxicus]AWC46817.1 Ger(x)C family spore germination protein [Bacillus cytotoxicus]AWC63044.1 Ger(x)C family spore germination protein [Bacillus cytotoxicus]KMT50058.1 spore gernimation protein GerLC [Bacillus cytotoxicus]